MRHLNAMDSGGETYPRDQSIVKKPQEGLPPGGTMSEYTRTTKSGERLRCIMCATPFIYDPAVPKDSCSTCGTKIQPVRIEHDVPIVLNWEEFRLLAAGAILSAKQSSGEQRRDQLRLLDAICARVSAQYPDLPGVQSSEIAGVEIMTAGGFSIFKRMS